MIRHEGRQATRQHREISLCEGARHILLQVGGHPKRQRVDLNRLREQRQPLDQGQNDNCWGASQITAARPSASVLKVEAGQ